MSERVPISVRFAPAHVAVGSDGSARLTLPTDGERPLRLAARLHRPGVIRDALLTLGDVLGSDLRRRATDRADYLAYLIQRGKGVSKAVWDAQREYLALQYGAAAQAEHPLDPVLTVAPAALCFEVMSRDESTYAQLVVRRPAALVDADRPGDGDGPRGSTYFDLAGSLAAIRRIRSYRSTTLDLAPPGPQDTAPAARRGVPLAWLRGLGQMQAATLLATDRFALAPIDLYNVLLALRLRRARTAPRSLRYELVPGEPPRLVLEPWDLVVHGSGGPYRGTAPRVIRTWGRDRLAALARVLPHARSLEVAVAGPGLPALYSADLGDASFSIALSGWTEAGWAGVSTFDLLAADEDPAALSAAEAALTAPRTEAELAAALGRSRADVRRTVLAGLAQLRLGHDLATGALFARSLTAAPIEPARLRFRDAREAAAHRLLGEPGAVSIAKVADVGGQGRAIEGRVVDGKAHRTFFPALTLDREGRTAGATCTCSAVRRAGIKEGPCEHLIALRVAYGRAQAALEAARATPEGRAQITAETRVLLRRTPRGAETYELTLDGRDVTARFGPLGDPARPPGAGARHAVAAGLRMQRQRFDAVAEARTAYFERLATLAAKGYLDATQE
jgi:hypothetical protein